MHLEVHPHRVSAKLAVPLVMAETIWILRSVYEQQDEAIVEAILSLTQSTLIEVQGATKIQSGFARYDGKSDLIDVLIANLNSAKGCEMTKTFDRKASRLENMSLLSKG